MFQNHLLLDVSLAATFIITFLFIPVTAQRYRRQQLPSENVQIHSFISNVSITDHVLVSSLESQIDFKELYVNGQVWSGASVLRFEPHGQSENLSARHNVSTLFKFVNNAYLHTKSDNLELNLTTNRTSDGHSFLVLNGSSGSNIAFNSSTGLVEVENATRFLFRATTWHLDVIPRMTIATNFSENYRYLVITVILNDYNIEIAVDGGNVGIRYGIIWARLSSDRHTLTLYSKGRIILIETVTSPISVFVNASEVIVRFIGENAVLQARSNSSDIDIAIRQFSRTYIHQQGGHLTVGNGTSFGDADIEITSLCSKMILRKTEYDSLQAQTNQSQLLVKTNLTQFAAVAEVHNIEANGGYANVTITTGNVSLTMTTNETALELSTLIPPFNPPTDMFAHVGPFQNHASEKPESSILPEQNTLFTSRLTGISYTPPVHTSLGMPSSFEDQTPSNTGGTTHIITLSGNPNLSPQTSPNANVSSNSTATLSQTTENNTSSGLRSSYQSALSTNDSGMSSFSSLSEVKNSITSLISSNSVPYESSTTMKVFSTILSEQSSLPTYGTEGSDTLTNLTTNLSSLGSEMLTSVAISVSENVDEVTVLESQSPTSPIDRTPILVTPSVYTVIPGTPSQSSKVSNESTGSSWTPFTSYPFLTHSSEILTTVTLTPSVAEVGDTDEVYTNPMDTSSLDTFIIGQFGNEESSLQAWTYTIAASSSNKKIEE